MNRSILAVALASLVLLAGCASGVPGTTDGTTTAPTGGDATAAMGSVDFYVSDEQNDIEDFEHLNVTISTVAFHQAGASDGDAEAEAGDEDEDGDASSNATTTDAADATPTTSDANTTVTTTTSDATATTTTNTTATTTDADANGDDDADSDADGDDDADSDGAASSDEWVVADVDEQTVDLTKLQGENATLLSQFDVPTGEYDVAMVYVSDVNATLKGGEQVRVKLPSEKLHVNTPFAVGANETVDFVFDITVHEAGNSGKYILKPVVTESGANVEKRVVDRQGKPEHAGGGDETEFTVSVDGNVSAGETVTVTVTGENGDPVEGAAVEVNGDAVGETNADGQLDVTVPDAEELEIEVESGDGEGDLEVGLTAEDDADAGEQNEAHAGNGNDQAATDDDDDDDDGQADGTAELAAAFTTEVAAGEDATIAVTDGDGAPVQDAVVRVNGEVVGETDTYGERTFQVPSDADEVEVVVTKGDAEVTLEPGVVAAAS